MTVYPYIRSEDAAPGDEDAARDAVASAAGEYASFPAYRRQFEAMGVGRAAAVAARARSQRGALPRDEVAPLLDAVCLHGAADAARARLDVFREAGCDLPVVYPVAFEVGDGPRSGDAVDGPAGAASVALTLRSLAPAF